MNDFIRVAWPAAALVAALLLALMVYRYLISWKCWRCGTHLYNDQQRRNLLGIVAVIPYTWSGWRSIRIF